MGRGGKMQEWKLNQDGFVMNYMVAGPRVTEFQTAIRNPNQLALEAQLRKAIVTEKKDRKDVAVRMGQQAECGESWSVYYSYGNCFVDRSAFYSTLQRVDMDVAVVLCAAEDVEVQAVLWTYMAVAVYCNGKLAAQQDAPAYKPIRRNELTLKLHRGRNLIYMQCENLGVRDTRNIVGLQIMDYRDKISVGLADEDFQEEVWKNEEFLNRLRLDGGKVVFSEKAPEGTVVCCPVVSPDYEKMHQPVQWQSVEGQTEFTVPQDKGQVQVKVCGAGGQMVRKLEVTGRIRPQYAEDGLSVEKNFEKIMERIAAVHSLDRGPFGFGIANVLARRYVECGRLTDGVKDGMQDSTLGEKDRELLLDTLDLIEQRVDCADFILCGLLRYMHEYEMDEELKVRAKEVLLHFRYWMTMDGADAMCFWSENHSLLFYTCAMDAGQMYPDAYFFRAAMTGEQLHQWGRDKVTQWLDDVERYGFEEFMSTVYLCITFVALLHVVDYGEAAIARRAAAVTDQMLETLCIHSFKGCAIAPMGRIYRNVIYPFTGDAQALLNLIDPAAPYSFGGGWLGCYGTSGYHFPEGLKELMWENQEMGYETGNALVKLEKNQDYCLTSVQSLMENKRRWKNVQTQSRENVRNQSGASVRTQLEMDVDSHEYVKSLNECFHGTTWFVSGTYGYQQHLWYGALDGEAVIFTNHPGATCDDSGMRPGYWYGNGVLPALRQEHGMIGVIYNIPEEHPVHFTHVYCPKERFDQAVKEGNWLFLSKDQGYMALWCSEETVPYDDVIFGCEMRVYGDEAAYLCVCGRAEEYGTFQKFVDRTQALLVRFDKDSNRLMVGDECFLQYEAGRNETQYVD